MRFVCRTQFDSVGASEKEGFHIKETFWTPPVSRQNWPTSWTNTSLHVSLDRREMKQQTLIEAPPSLPPSVIRPCLCKLPFFWLKTLDAGNYSVGDQQSFKLMCSRQHRTWHEERISPYLVRTSVLGITTTGIIVSSLSSCSHSFDVILTVQFPLCYMFFIFQEHKEAVYPQPRLSIFDSCLRVWILQGEVYCPPQQGTKLFSMCGIIVWQKF